MDVRYGIALIAIAATVGAGAQTFLDGPAVIKQAVSAGLARPQVFVGVSGWSQVGNGPEELQRLRVYIQGNKFAIQSFVNNEVRLTIIADGSKVWRYDQVTREYTYLKQPEDLSAAFGVAAAFERAEFQRTLRLLSGSVNWLVNPKWEIHPTTVRVYATKPIGSDDWRGTDLHFTFDAEYGKMAAFTIEDRIALSDGRVSRDYYSGGFIYDRPFNMDFTFTPPPGSKPAADLPRRGG